MKKPIKIILFIIFLIFVVSIVVFFDFEKLIKIENILIFKDNLIQKNKIITLFSVLGLYFIFSFLFLTIAPLSILSGILFDTFIGAAVAFIGSSITMSISFLISRFFLNSFFSKLKQKNRLFQNILVNLSKNGKDYILFARLFFITPYNSLNIVSGISDIKVKDYIISSIIGCIPSTFFYAYCGSILNTLKDYSLIKKNAIIVSIITLIFFAIIFIAKKIYKNRIMKIKN
ncbi:MAG: TVP38/TMEM64 family protein [Exilispira sp.]